jgi:hypothetical protein
LFAWTYENMPSIDPEIMVHKLSVRPMTQSVQPKRWTLAFF